MQSTKYCLAKERITIGEAALPTTAQTQPKGDG